MGAPFVPVPDRSAGYPPAEADWDLLKDNFNNSTWVLLADTTLVATATAFDFTSIPQTYAHLLIYTYLRGDAAFTNGNGSLRFNADSGANYDRQRLVSAVTVGAASEVLAATSVAAAVRLNHATAPANVFAGTKLMIPYYANTSNNKAFISEWSIKMATSSGGLEVAKTSGFWRSNAAISRVTITIDAGNFVIGSRATMYGLS